MLAMTPLFHDNLIELERSLVLGNGGSYTWYFNNLFFT